MNIMVVKRGFGNWEIRMFYFINWMASDKHGGWILWCWWQCEIPFSNGIHNDYATLESGRIMLMNHVIHPQPRSLAVLYDMKNYMVHFSPLSKKVELKVWCVVFLYSSIPASLCWYSQFHFFFTLFVLDVVPKKILVAMNVPGLERGHVASHLQVSFYLHFIFFLYFIIILLLLIVAECELFFMARNIETL